MRSKLQGVCSAESRTAVTSLVPSRLMMRASPGCSSFTSAVTALKAVWMTGRSEAATMTSSSSYQKQGRMPLGSRAMKASPVPTMPPIT